MGKPSLGSASGHFGSIQDKSSGASGLSHEVLTARARSSFAGDLGMSRAGVAATSRAQPSIQTGSGSEGLQGKA